MKKTKIIKKALSLVLCCALIFVTISSLTSCEDDSYYKDIQWSFNNEILTTKYFDLYDEEIKRLLIKYELSDYFVEVTTDIPYVNKIKYTFRSKECTLLFSMLNNTSWGYAFYSGELYCYKPVGETLIYSDIAPFVNLLNDFTNYAAFSAKTEGNHFELLFNEALESGEGYSGDCIYEDSLIGKNKYTVILDFDLDIDYYRLGSDDGLEMDSHYLQFEGLLKPLEISEE